ncbi:MAG: hypothetical protein GEU92_12680 [Alphaproteobacteria bacterium]|nr:hypothetical protein [Alphaproteobacteria bacterium]
MIPTSTVRRLAQGLCVATLGISLVGVAQAAGCADARERESLTVRSLQTDLMVAALSCNVRDDYNTFVQRYRPHLSGHGHALRRYFQRAYGPRAQRALDRYVTELANQASQVSNADRTAFCAQTAASLNMLLAATDREGAHVLASLAAGGSGASLRDPAPSCDALTRR